MFIINMKILPTNSIVFLYGTTDWALKLVINLYFMNLCMYDKGVNFVQDFLHEDWHFYAMMYFSDCIISMIFVSGNIIVLCQQFQSNLNYCPLTRVLSEDLHPNFERFLLYKL